MEHVFDYICEENEDGGREFSFIGSLDSGNFFDFENSFLKDIESIHNITLDFKNVDFICDAAVGFFHLVSVRIKRLGGKIEFKNMNADVETRVRALEGYSFTNR